MSATRRGASSASKAWLLAAGLTAITGGAPVRGATEAELDCSELAALESLADDTAAPSRHHYLHVEELLLRRIASWPERGDEETAGQISDLEQRLSERLECLGEVSVAHPGLVPRRGTGRPGALFVGSSAPGKEALLPFACLAVVEGRALEPIFGRQPRTLLAVARLYQRKQAHQLGQRRLWHARRSLGQVRSLLEAHLAAAGDGADRSAAATILALAAFALADLPYIRTTEEAVEALHEALEIDAEHSLALYLAAHYEEKLADFPHARLHLEVLEGVTGGDSEVRLRLAMNLARLGNPDRARERLARLTATSPDWVAIVASQELARLLAEDGRPEEAAAVLEQALERFPGRSQLRLQLAQVRHTDWRASWPLVDRVLNGWQGDQGEPARVEYERERLSWVREAVTRLDWGLQDARGEVGREADRLRRRPLGRRRALAERVESLCRGTLPLRRLPGDPGSGPFAPGSPGAGR